MRMYKKINENNEKAVYEYLYGDYTLPYTGLVEINKIDEKASLIKSADGEGSPTKAAAYALMEIPKLGYPDLFTHNAA